MINAVDQRHKVKPPGRLLLGVRRDSLISIISLSTFCVYFFSFYHLNPVYGADYPPIPALALPAAPTGPISSNEVSKAVAADPKAAETAKEATAVTKLIDEALAPTNSNAQGVPKVSVAQVAAAVELVTKAAAEAKANAEKAVEVASKAIEVAKEKAAVAEAVTAKAQEALAEASNATEVAAVATQQAQVATQQAQVATQQAQVATQQAQVATQQAQVSARAAENAVNDYQEALAAGRLMANLIADRSEVVQKLDESEKTEKFSIRRSSGVIAGGASVVTKIGPVAERLKIIADAAVEKAAADKAAAVKAEDAAKAAQAKAAQAKVAADKAAADAKAAKDAADKANAEAAALKLQADKANAEAAASQVAAAQAATLANAKTLAAQAAAQLASEAKKKLASFKSKFTTSGSNSSPESGRPAKSPTEGEVASPKPNEDLLPTGSTSSQNTAATVFLVVIISLLVGLASRQMYRKRTRKNSMTESDLPSFSDRITVTYHSRQSLGLSKDLARKSTVKKAVVRKVAPVKKAVA
jgi:hypothetical protein